MNKDFRNSVVITITAESIEDGTGQEKKIDVRGEWVKKGNTHYLRYSEQECATSTLVKWVEDVEEVFVIRQGETSVRQHFSPHHELFTVYSTPYGQYSLRTVTNQVQMNLTDTKGQLHMHYFTQLGDADPIEHRMSISFELLT